MPYIFSAAAQCWQQSLLLQNSISPAGGFSIFSLLVKGGLIMAPLALLSLLSVYFFVERLLYIRFASRIDTELLKKVELNLKEYKPDVALAVCRFSPTPVARILEKGLIRVGSPMRDLESAMESMARIEISHLEKNLNLLAAIATIAPMLGFLGTVTGMLRTFYSISLYKNISIDIIAGGIYEKMITSAAGLVIGIMAYVLYTLANSMIERCVSKLEAASLNLLDVLSQSSSYELQEK